MPLYKYLSPDRLDVLENSCVRFTQPDQLNDPFESRPNMSAIRRSARASLAKRNPKAPAEQIEQGVDQFIEAFPNLLGESMVVLSLSGTCRNQLMWAHYCDSHQGFTIGFDPQSTFFSSKREGPTKITYAKERAIIPLDEDNPSKTSFLAGNKDFLLTKSDEWDYEEEFRVLADPNTAETSIRTDDGTDIHLFAFPSSAVREVILGYNTKPQDESRIRAIVAKKYPDAKLLKAQLNESEFRMDIVPAPPKLAAPVSGVPIVHSTLPPIGENSQRPSNLG